MSLGLGMVFGQNRNGANWEEFLDDILKTAEENPCVTCLHPNGTPQGMPGRTQMHKHLENVEYYLSNFNDNKFNHWIRGKTVNGSYIENQNTIDEINQTLLVLKRDGFTGSEVQLGGNFQIGNNEYDIYITNSKIFCELKNAIIGNQLPEQYINQLVNGYFKNATSIDKIKWEAGFAKNKGKNFNIDINGTVYTKIASNPDDFKEILKLLWKKEFSDPAKKSDIFNTIWDNQGLRNSLFPDLPTNITPQVKQQYFGNQFESLVNSTNSNLYNIIKTQ